MHSPFTCRTEACIKQKPNSANASTCSLVRTLDGGLVIGCALFGLLRATSGRAAGLLTTGTFPARGGTFTGGAAGFLTTAFLLSGAGLGAALAGALAALGAGRAGAAVRPAAVERRRQGRAAGGGLRGVEGQNDETAICSALEQ